MRSRKLLRLVSWPFFLLAVFALLVAVPVGLVHGQASKATGTIEGVVYDRNRAVIPNATVTVTEKQTSLVREVSSDETGSYRIVLLPPGLYTIRVEAAGFRVTAIETIELSVGQTLGIPITLEPGAVSVTVYAESEALIETSSQSSTTINARSVASLPLTGRNYMDLALLSPGVSSRTSGGEDTNFNGQRSANNNISLDGLDASSPVSGSLRGGAVPQSLVSLESVKELQVVTNGASAEFGRSSGTFVNLITKGGTNDFHGSAFFNFRDKALASDNADAVAAMVPTKDFRQYQFGGNVGGPIKQNRAFFFVSYERISGDSSRFNRIDPRLVHIFAERFGSPDEEGLIERTYNSDSALGRIDLSIGKKNNLALRYGYGIGEQKNSIFDVPSWGRSANGREENHASVFNANLVTAFTPNLGNEFRFQYARESRPDFYEGPDIPDVSIGSIDPRTGELTSYRFGRPFFSPRSLFDTRIQFLDDVSIIRGPHSIKAGFEFSRARINQTYPTFARGRYIFASVEAFEDYLDNPKNFSGLLYYSQFAPVGGRTFEQAGTQELTQIEPGFFIQDEWKAIRNLTINYGLRYEAQIQDQPITPLKERRYAQFIGQPGFPSDGSIPSEKKGWQPRFSIAWDPFGDAKTVVRANIGLYYARVPGFVIASARNTDGAIAYSISTCCGLDFLPAPPANLGIFTNTAGLIPFNPGVRVFASDFRGPRTLQWGASIEREVIKDLSVTFGFNYANTVHLTRFVNRNGPTFTGSFAADGRRVFDGPQPFARPDGSGIGELATAESSARSLYRAFTFEARKRFTNRYQFMANYVLSWDYSDDDEGNPFAFRYSDVLDFHPEYSYSDRDQRHRFNVSGIVELPFEFQISAIFQARSAQPGSLFLLSDTNKDGNAFDRPFSAKRDVGRNTRRKKNNSSSMDIRVTRKVRHRGENKRAELFAEIFNTFNSTNFIPLPNPSLFNFDTRVRAGFGDPRQIQFGVRFVF
jgi:hypothetical protein